MSSDRIVKGIIDDIINTAVKTAEVDEQETKYLQHFILVNYQVSGRSSPKPVRPKVVLALL